MSAENELVLTDKQRTWIMTPLIIGGFIAMLNETLLNVAFPQLMSDLNVSTSTVQWLSTAYVLVIGILVPVVAFLLKTFSTRKLYLAAILLFTAGTILCAIAQTFPALLVFRLVQGAGSGMMIPIMMNTVLEIYPPEKRGAALGICMMVVVAAPGVGPAISGLTLQYLNWHWLFIILLPFSLLAIFIGAATIKNVTMLTCPKIDIPSIILSTLGFGGVIYGICAIETKGLFDIIVFISLLCGIGSLVLFSIRQLSLKQPLLELRVFKYPSFTLGVVIIFIAFMMPISVSIILPTFMQSGLGISPAMAGFAVLPGSILNALIAPISGRLCDKVGGKPLAIIGFSILTVAMFILSHVSASVTLAELIILHICIFSGVSLIFTPIQTTSLNQLPSEYNPHGVAVLNTAQQISAAFGSSLFIGLMGTVQENYLETIANPDTVQQCDALTHGMNAAFTASLVMVVIGLGVSIFLKKKIE